MREITVLSLADKDLSRLEKLVTVLLPNARQ